MKDSPNGAIQIDQTTLEETVQRITPEFPYMTGICDLHHFPGNAFPWHWHKEVELFYMTAGELDYVLPSGTYTFRQGEGGFINANVLHMTVCRENQPCLQQEHIFLPQFVGGQEHSIFMRRYILPIIRQTDLDLFRFNPQIPEHQRIIGLLEQSYRAYQSKKEGYEFDIRESMTKIWFLLYTLTKDITPVKKAGLHSDRVKIMMEYIASHYHEKVTLKAIADTCFISVRECCRCFQENLGQSPFSYLMEYRLYKACSLLEHTSLSVTEIGSACGFNTSSYFGKSFRSAFGCSPREYRNRRQAI